MEQWRSTASKPERYWGIVTTLRKEGGVYHVRSVDWRPWTLNCDGSVTVTHYRQYDTITEARRAFRSYSRLNKFRAETTLPNRALSQEEIEHV